MSLLLVELLSDSMRIVVRKCTGSCQVVCSMPPVCRGRLEQRTLQIPPSHVPVQMQLSEQALPTSHVACKRAGGEARKCGAVM